MLTVYWANVKQAHSVNEEIAPYKSVRSESCPCAYLIKQHVMKTYGGVEVQLQYSWPRRQMEVTIRPHYLRERSTHWLGGWVGPTDGLDAVE
jgi:hypothetical protein